MAPVERRRWTRDELLLVLHLYTRIPFGQQHARNPQVIDLAGALGRTPSSVAMKLNNFTSLDPYETARGVKGLEGASVLDAEVWAEFESRHAEVAPETEALWQARVERRTPDRNRSGGAAAEGRRTETAAERRVRLGQDYFRREHRLVVGRRVRDAFGRDESERFFACEGRRLDEPARHALSEALLARHRETFRRLNA